MRSASAPRPSIAATRSPLAWPIQRAVSGAKRLSALQAARAASTAPFSTAGSWSGSPSRISRHSGFSARSSLAISGRSTIEHSSTTSTSSSSGRARSRAGCMDCAWKPSSRCRVVASDGRSARCASLSGSLRKPSCTDSLSRCAALPVGAARAMRSGPGAKCRTRASTRKAVKVLPVPGPPQMTVSGARRATVAATLCQSVSSSSAEGSTASSAAATSAAVGKSENAIARWRNAASISRS